MQDQQAIVGPSPTCMESVNRISKFPVVESTIQTATSIYGKVKDYNSVTHWTFATAESTVNKAYEVGKPIATPVIRNLEGPIKKVDGVLCSGLDYVESKVPAVKLPPGELLLQIYTTTKDYVNNTVTPAVESAYHYAEPAYKTAKDLVEPAMISAKNAVEPAVEKARSIVEPLVQPAMDTASAIKDNVMHKVDEYLHRGHNHEASDPYINNVAGGSMESDHSYEAAADVVKPDNQATKDILEPDHKITNDIVEANHKTTNDIVEPENKTTNDIVEPENKTTNDIVEPENKTTNAIVEPDDRSTNGIVEPEMQFANEVVESAVETAEEIMEELEMETSSAVEEIVTNKGDEDLHGGHDKDDTVESKVFLENERSQQWNSEEY